jgi:hypothetical protein
MRDVRARWGAPSPAFLVALAVSAVLGAIGGLALRLLDPPFDWNVFTAAGLWMLISAAGTTIGRASGEKLRRGDWRRAFWLAGVQTLPLATVFLLVAALLGPGFPLIPAVAPALFGAAIVLVFVLAGLCAGVSVY